MRARSASKVSRRPPRVIQLSQNHVLRVTPSIIRPRCRMIKHPPDGGKILQTAAVQRERIARENTSFYARREPRTHRVIFKMRDDGPFYTFARITISLVIQEKYLAARDCDISIFPATVNTIIYIICHTRGSSARFSRERHFPGF